MQTEIFQELEQRADYTFKYNVHFGRHGWLRLTPAYSVKLVREILKKDTNQKFNVLDPFSGTATTGLVSAELGLNATLFDINPFLIWFGNTKCYHFNENDLTKLQSEFEIFLNDSPISDNTWLPPIHNIDRWWHTETLKILGSIRQGIENRFGNLSINYQNNLVWIAFSRLAIETSAAAFNHISMSFKKDSIQYEDSDVKFLFRTIFNHVVSSAKKPLLGKAKVLKGDSRNLSPFDSEMYDIVITSPPYPNRISYIRELRPYMYWLKFLASGSDAGMLDWKAIGGTWGTATSNLKDWQAVTNRLPQGLYAVCDKIRQSGDKNSLLMSNYVHKYFDDMYLHLCNLRPLLKSNARLNYIVGNSSFYGHFVNTDLILAEILKDIGFQKINIETIRKRNTKKGLLEFNVSARWCP